MKVKVPMFSGIFVTVLTDSLWGLNKMMKQYNVIINKPMLQS